MAHAGTTLDLGRSRPTTNEKRPGWFRAPLLVALAVALGLAVGAAAWTFAGSQSVNVANRTAYVAAIHEKIEAHRAAVAAGADRATDPIEAHRTTVANAAVHSAFVNDLSIRRGYDPMPIAGTAGRGLLVDLSIRRGYDPMPIAGTAGRGLLDDLSIRRGYDRMPIANVAGRGLLDDFSIRRGYDQMPTVIVGRGLVDDLSIRRGYDPMPAVIVGRAYTQEIVIGHVPLNPGNGADAVVGYPWPHPLR